MSNPFDYVNAINFSKKDLMTGTENDELAEKSYVPFVTNRSLSYFPDTIMYAQEMNRNHHIDNKLQFDYLLGSIRPKKRFSKWAKSVSEKDLDIVMQHYKCNTKRAQEYLRLLTSEQLAQIRRSMEVGGRK